MKHKSAVLNFRSWGRHHVPGHRVKYNAWRLKWWYMSAVLRNHRKQLSDGYCLDQKGNYPHGSFPLKSNKRWGDQTAQARA